MQMERQMSELDRMTYLENMRKKIIDPGVMELIEADLKSGLTDKEINDYATRGLSLEQMRVVSEMYHKKFPINVIAKIGALEVDAEKMKVAVELHENKVELKEIEAFLGGAKTAHDMRAAFSNVLGRVQAALAVTEEEVEESRKDDPESGSRPAYVDELVEQLKSVVQKINYQDERYDVLNQKLMEFETVRKEEAVEKNLVALNEQLEKENRELSEQLESKQDEIAQGLQTVSKLRNEVENGKEEMKKMQKVIDGLKEEKSSLKETAGEPGLAEDKSEPESTPAQKIPIYYTMTLVKDGKVLQNTDVEYTHRKPSVFAGIMSRFALKKKSHRDLVQLVINNELSPEQVNEITGGLEHGLDEEQLELIINKNLSPERIRSIVGFAALQNKLKTGRGEE
jgi:myosin heavy subunit